MACQKCASNQSTSCSCQGTSYTIPTNAVYGDSTCKLPAEPCESVTCSECVRHCHEEDKWCVKYPTVTGAVELCMRRGERLDQFLQKIALASSNAAVYPFAVKNFFVDNLTGGANPTIKFIWYDFEPAVTDIKLLYAPEGSGDFQTIPAFANINPLLNNTFTVDSTMILLTPGTTYKFKLSTSTFGNTVGAEEAVYESVASVQLTVTIPA
tara:strand:+ start:4466 stop:5095 length:630 start_codon:yes stop_codon:yes gene_type:complete